MPEQKGRRSKRDRERARRRDRPESDAAPVAPSPVRQVRPAKSARVQQPLPSATTRGTGAMLAFVTAIGAVWVIYDAISSDKAGPDLVARLAAGAFLFALVIVVGVLSLAPETARKILRQFLTTKYRATEGDTVESIARAHGISARDVLAANPELHGGVTPGVTVFMPRPRR